MLVTGRELLPGRSEEERRAGLIATAVAAIAGGVTVVQLREKDLDIHTIIELCLRLRSAVPRDVTLMLNGPLPLTQDPRFPFAADGIHLPESSPAPDPGRRFRGLVGRSVHSVESAQEAAAAGTDYLVAGTVFETPSHPGAKGRGLEFLEAVCSAVSKPVLAIGGIQPEHVTACLAAGAAGVAVRSPILTAPDPAEAAGRYAAALRAAKWPGVTRADAGERG